MADYYTPTIVHQSIPRRMMSPVEEFILKHVFEWEDDPDVVGNIYFLRENTQPRTLQSTIKRDYANSSLIPAPYPLSYVAGSRERW
jgi:hypothetical protein